MKKIIVLTAILSLLSIASFFYLFYYESTFKKIEDNNEYKKIQKQIKELEKEKDNKEKEIEELKNSSQEKLQVLDLWQKELEKAKNY